jgi:ribosomal protein S18 acetylase RimI-like enzyme
MMSSPVCRTTEHFRQRGIDEIRPYRPDDWPDLCAVHDASRLFELRASIGDSAFLPLAETGENEGIFDGRLDVAQINGAIVGFVGFSDDELTWLYVHPGHFGKGIGRQLLRHAIEAAGPVFQTEVLEGNNIATKLYESEGFLVVDRSVGKLAGNESFSAVGLVLERRRQDR